MIGLKPRLALAVVAVAVGAAAVAYTVLNLRGEGGASPQTAAAPAPVTSTQTSAAPAPRRPTFGPTPRPGAPPLGGPPPLASEAGSGCEDVAYTGGAVANALSLGAAPSGSGGVAWAPFAPLVSREIGTACPPDTAGFARALARWRRAHALAPAGGAMDAPALQALRDLWNARRPFVAASQGGACPASPPPAALLAAEPAEGYQGKPVQLLPGALFAYRRMVAAARAQIPDVAADPQLLTLFSGWRGPDEEAQRCADGSCDGKTKSACSAHRTGTAVDLYLGGPPGSSNAADRLAKSRTPAYRWLVAHADRFGFTPYPFEPWHWEWTGGGG